MEDRSVAVNNFHGKLLQIHPKWEITWKLDLEAGGTVILGSNSDYPELKPVWWVRGGEYPAKIGLPKRF